MKSMTESSENSLVVKKDKEKWEETKRVTEEDERLEAEQRSVSHLHPSTSCFTPEMLIEFLLLFKPINNPICCHMTMLRPGMQPPNLLNPNE